LLFDEYVSHPVILRSEATKDLGWKMGSNDEIATPFCGRARNDIEGLGETRIERI